MTGCRAKKEWQRITDADAANGYFCLTLSMQALFGRGKQKYLLTQAVSKNKRRIG